MPEKDQQETPLSERVVKEAVGVGMDTPLRDPILEAVEEAEGTSPPAKRTLPAAGALVGLGAAFGYLLGRKESEELFTSGEDETESVDSVDDEDVIEASTTVDDDEPTAGDDADTDETDIAEIEEEDGRSRLRLVALVTALAGIGALVWRRKQATDEEWEPIEEFEPATDVTTTFGSDDETTDDETTADDSDTASDDTDGETASAESSDDER